MIAAPDQAGGPGSGRKRASVGERRGGADDVARQLRFRMSKAAGGNLGFPIGAGKTEKRAA